jgi:hypothetical protein
MALAFIKSVLIAVVVISMAICSLCESFHGRGLYNVYVDSCCGLLWLFPWQYVAFVRLSMAVALITYVDSGCDYIHDNM